MLHNKLAASFCDTRGDCTHQGICKCQLSRAHLQSGSCVNLSSSASREMLLLLVANTQRTSPNTSPDSSSCVPNLDMLSRR